MFGAIACLDRCRSGWAARAAFLVGAYCKFWGRLWRVVSSGLALRQVLLGGFLDVKGVKCSSWGCFCFSDVGVRGRDEAGGFVVSLCCDSSFGMRSPLWG